MVRMLLLAAASLMAVQGKHLHECPEVTSSFPGEFDMNNYPSNVTISFEEKPVPTEKCCWEMLSWWSVVLSFFGTDREAKKRMPSPECRGSRVWFQTKIKGGSCTENPCILVPQVIDNMNTTWQEHYYGWPTECCAACFNATGDDRQDCWDEKHPSAIRKKCQAVTSYCKRFSMDFKH